MSTRPSPQTPAALPSLGELFPPLGLVVRAGELALRPFADQDLPE